MIQPAWDNHFSAFGEQDLAKIMLDYNEDSVISVHDIATGANSQHSGMVAIEAMFAGLFAELDDLSELSAPVVKVEEGPAEQVFLVWACPSSGITQATDTFAFDSAGTIIRQNIVVWRKGASATATFTGAGTMYPDYAGSMAVTGTATATFADASAYAMAFSVDLAGLEADATGGVHIHSGTSCDDAADVGGHYWTPDTDADPWTTKWVSDADGMATASFWVDQGYGFADTNGHAVVVHAADGTRIACSTLMPPTTDLNAVAANTKTQGGWYVLYT